MPGVAAGGGTTFGPSYRSGDFISPPFTADGSFTTVSGTAYFAAVYISRSVTVDQIATWVRATAGSSTVRLGLYNDASGRPSTLIVDGGTIDSASGTGAKAITLIPTQILAAGTYWVCAQPDGGAPGLDAASNKVALAPVTNVSNVNFGNGFSYAHTGALASDVTAVSWTSINVVPLTFLRVV